MSDERNRKPILLIVGGVLQIILAFICAFFGVIVTATTIMYLRNTHRFLMPDIISQGALGLVGIIAFAFGLSGGILSLKRKRFPLAILGILAILAWDALFFMQIFYYVPATFVRATFTGIAFVLFAFLFTILSLVFIAISKKDFN